MSRNTSLAYLFFSILFIAFTFIPDPRAFWMFKIFPIILLCVEVTRDTNFSSTKVLITALIASVFGDMLLHFDMFVPGLSAFLIAQVFYAFLFLKNRKSFKNRFGITLILSIYLIGVLFVLYPKLGGMQIPVIAYMAVISLMGFLAVQSSYPMKWAVLGALAFILSDSLIAVNKFIFDIPFERLVVMSTYYAAQWMLVKGFLDSTINNGELVTGK